MTDSDIVRDIQHKKYWKERMITQGIIKGFNEAWKRRQKKKCA